MKILIVEDHAVYRDGIKNLLLQMESPCELLEAATAAAGLNLVQQHTDLDLVLIDIKLPDTNGFDAMAQFMAAQATLPMVILSASEDLADMQKALDNGAMGFIPKSMSSEIMLSAIKLVLSGGIYVPPEMVKNYSLMHNNDMQIVLTQRQQQVFDLLLVGQSNKMIAKTLSVSLPTVKAHVGAIFKALNVATRSQAIAVAKNINPDIS